jgi:hypothetical protein
LISFNICANFFKIYLGDIKSDDTMGKMSRKGLNLMCAKIRKGKMDWNKIIRSALEDDFAGPIRK